MRWIFGSVLLTAFKKTQIPGNQETLKCLNSRRPTRWTALVRDTKNMTINTIIGAFASNREFGSNSVPLFLFETLAMLLRNKQKGPISPQDFKDGGLFQEW